MSTNIDVLISVHGRNFTVNQVSDGSVDSYGDPAPTWSTAATEKVWIQDPDMVFRDKQISEALAGKIDDRTFVGFLLSTSVIAKGNVIIDSDDSTRYDVQRVWTSKLFDEESHKIAILRKSEDA